VLYSLCQDIRGLAAQASSKAADAPLMNVVVLTIVLTCVVLIAALAFYAMHRSKPSRLKLSATLLKASFSIEVEALDDREGRELLTRADDADGKPAG
jgi:hypothetical protein